MLKRVRNKLVSGGGRVRGKHLHGYIMSNNASAMVSEPGKGKPCSWVGEEGNKFTEDPLPKSKAPSSIQRMNICVSMNDSYVMYVR